MKKVFCGLLLVWSACLITACGEAGENRMESQTVEMQENIAIAEKKQEERQIQVSDMSGNTVVFALNDSSASETLYEQLPMTAEVENFGNNEKIFYTSQELNYDEIPVAKGDMGTLASYIPWGNVIMYYGTFEPSDLVVELGYTVSGSDKIKQLSGKIEISAVKQIEK